MFEPSSKKQGFARLIAAFTNTCKGIVWMTKNEAAFRQELIVSFVLIVFSCYLEISLKEQAMLIISLLFVLFTETLNTAIEAVVDRIGYEYHELSGLAKDLASGAVFISMVIAVITWLAILLG